MRKFSKEEASLVFEEVLSNPVYSGSGWLEPITRMLKSEIDSRVNGDWESAGWVKKESEEISFSVDAFEAAMRSEAATETVKRLKKEKEAGMKWTKQWSVPSSSNATKSYTVSQADDGSFGCSCKAWTGRRIQCKHIKSIQANIGGMGSAYVTEEFSVEDIFKAAFEADHTHSVEFVPPPPPLTALQKIQQGAKWSLK